MDVGFEKTSGALKNWGGGGGGGGGGGVVVRLLIIVFGVVTFKYMLYMQVF